MRRVFFVAVLLLSVNILAVAQKEKFKVGAPSDSVFSKGRANFQDWATKQMQNYSSAKSGRVWVVLSDRENNPTYNQPDIYSGQHSTLGFGEKLYVADIKKGFALVFSSPIKQNDFPNIQSPDWKGWVPVEHLLMWNQCPKNEKQIYNKGVVVFSPNKDAKIKQNPNYLLSPNPNATESFFMSIDLEILYVMKKERVNGETYFLLSKTYKLDFNGRYENELLGWLSQDYLTEWNFRLVLEPSFASGAVDCYTRQKIYPAIFPEGQDGINNAKNFQTTGKAKETLWVYDQFSTERMDPYRMRNPILGNVGELYNVATLSTFEQSNGDINAKMNARRKIQQYREAKDNVNLIFVIDNTQSMRNYYPAVARSLEEILSRDIKSKLRVGAVLYKDHPDSPTVKYKPLTDNVNEIIGFINANKDNCNSVDPDAWEAVVEGLETALDTIKMRYNRTQSTFIVLIGDAGNRDPDQGVKWEDNVKRLAAKLSDNNINFLAYQVNNSGIKADRDFGSQVGAIQAEYANKVSDKIRKEVAFRHNSNRGYSMERVNNPQLSLPIYNSYCYLRKGQSETTIGLQNFIKGNFNDFLAVVDSNIAILEQTIRGGFGSSTGGLQEQRVREILDIMNVPQKEIESIVQGIKSGGVVKFFGYAPSKIKGICGAWNLFDFVLLFTEDELSELIQRLGVIFSSDGKDAQKVQDAMITIGQSMIGNFDPTKFSVNEMLDQIYGIPITVNTCGDLDFRQEKLERIIYRKEEELKLFWEDFTQKLTNLVTIRRNTKGKFSQGEQTYYWIRLSDMPGICE